MTLAHMQCGYGHKYKSLTGNSPCPTCAKKEEVIAESNVTCFQALLSAFASRNWPMEWQQFCEVVDTYEKKRIEIVSEKAQENLNKTVYDGLEVRKI